MNREFEEHDSDRSVDSVDICSRIWFVLWSTRFDSTIRRSATPSKLHEVGEPGVLLAELFITCDFAAFTVLASCFTGGSFAAAGLVRARVRRGFDAGGALREPEPRIESNRITEVFDARHRRRSGRSRQHRRFRTHID